MPNWKEKLLIVFFLVATFLTYLAFGLQHLTKFQTADEHYWMYEDPSNGRIWNYWSAVSEKNWKWTYINDKPGVSLAYISGVALFFKNQPIKDLFQENGFERIYNPQEIERVHFLFRLPLLIFNGLFVFLLFWFTWKFTESQWIALWTTMLTWLSPILLGISQIVNPDSVLWTFSAGAIFAFLAYLKSKEKKFAFFTSLFLGFALLTKYSAIILVPFFLLAIFIEFLFRVANQTEIKVSEIKKTLLVYLLIILGACLLFAILLPAVLTDLYYIKQIITNLKGIEYLLLIILLSIVSILLDGFFLKNKLFLATLKRINPLAKIAPRFLALIFFLGFIFILIVWGFGTEYGETVLKNVSFDSGKANAFTKMSFLMKLILEQIPLVFSITPIVLFFALFALVRKNPFTKIIFLILLFLSSFYLAVILQDLLVTIRYSIILYPLVFLLAGIGIDSFFSLKKLEKINKFWISGAIFLISLLSLFESMPFYFNYTNMFLPKERIITDAWGYGGYEAGEYLNNLPDAQNLLVWTDYNGYCPFLKTRCVMGKSDGKFKLKENDPVPDYFVKTRRGATLYRGMWDTINSKHLQEKKETAWEIIINKRVKNYVKVFERKNPPNIQR